MAITTCVACDEEIEIAGRPRLGQKLVCYSCGARLEVVSTNPLEVDWPYEGDEDDDDWDDELEEGDGELDDEFGDDDDEFGDDDDFDDDDEPDRRL